MISAKQCPDERLAMLRAIRHEGIERELQSMHKEADPEYAIQNATNLYERVLVAGLWWVSYEMQDLLFTAATTMPAFDLSFIDYAAHPVGLVFFDTPFGINLAKEPYGIGEVHAIYWSATQVILDPSHTPPTRDPYPSGAVPSLNLRAWHRDTHGWWSCTGHGYWDEGFSCDELSPHDGKRNGGLPEASRVGIALARTVAALWRLSEQTRIVQHVDQPADNHSRKRSRRAGAESNVRLLYLRRQSTPHEPDKGGREYHHRWMVSGHWRNQPWGPKRALRRPVWIAPHIKGPDDKPLDIRPTVKALVR